MDWNDHFERLSTTQQLGVAAAFAERVVPLAADISALDDGLTLVWLQVGGRSTKKLELARALNAAIASAALDPDGDDSRTYAARCVFGVLEAALHNPFAATESVACALAAARALSERALAEETRWLRWAITTAGEADEVQRDMFVANDAPVSTWRTNLSSDNLPLFGSHQ